MDVLFYFLYFLHPVVLLDSPTLKLVHDFCVALITNTFAEIKEVPGDTALNTSLDKNISHLHGEQEACFCLKANKSPKNSASPFIPQ